MNGISHHIRQDICTFLILDPKQELRQEVVKHAWKTLRYNSPTVETFIKTHRFMPFDGSRKTPKEQLEKFAYQKVQTLLARNPSLPKFSETLSGRELPPAVYLHCLIRHRRRTSVASIIQAQNAARNNRPGILMELANLGVDLNQQDESGRTPLHLAVWRGHLNVVMELAKIGVDLNQKNKFGRTPLHLAAMQGHLNVVMELAKISVDLNQQDENGRTPLHLAAMQGHLNVVKHLLKLNVEIEISNYHGKTPLYDALSYDRIDLIQREIEISNYHGKTPLYDALSYDRIDLMIQRQKIAKCLIKNGANLDHRDNEGHTPLMCAIYHFAPTGIGSQSIHNYVVTRIKFLDYLVRQRQDLNAQSNNGNTALHFLHQEFRNFNFCIRYGSYSRRLVQPLERFGDDLASRTEIVENHQGKTPKDMGDLKKDMTCSIL